MRVISCLNPQYITNPYNHKKMVVSCGKCEACLNRHASFWVKKLRAEQRSWRFCMFVTLTYEDKYLPVLHIDDVDDVAFDLNNDTRIPISQLITKDSKSNKYMFSRLRSRLGLPYCNTDLIQKFHKRLNKYIHDNYTKKYQNFRYFLATEISPTTHRPHHHGLYFFNSREVARDFKEILFATWQYSNNFERGVQAEQVTGNAASYVAQYINCFANLPAVYKDTKLRPRFYFSKSPSLGSLLPLDEEVCELFTRCSPTRIEYDAKRNIYVRVRIPFSLENRLYPRIAGFDKTDYSCRVRLFGICSRETDFKGFIKTLLKFRDDFNYQSEHFSFASDTDKICYSYLNWLTDGFRFSKHNYLDPSSFKRTINRVLRFFYIVRRVNVQCSKFGVSLPYYLTLIDRYYSNLDYYHLKNMYDAQVSYSLAHDPDDFALMYADSEKYLFRYQQEVIPDFEKSFAFRDLMSTSKMIYQNNTKTHCKNEYFDKMKDGVLRKIINSYLYG